MKEIFSTLSSLIRQLDAQDNSSYHLVRIIRETLTIANDDDLVDLVMSFTAGPCCTVVIDSFDVERQKKIGAIKAVRVATGLGLKEAKDKVEDVQFTRVKIENLSAEVADDLVRDLNEAGYDAYRL